MLIPGTLPTYSSTSTIRTVGTVRVCTAVQPGRVQKNNMEKRRFIHSFFKPHPSKGDLEFTARRGTLLKIFTRRVPKVIHRLCSTLSVPVQYYCICFFPKKTLSREISELEMCLFLLPFQQSLSQHPLKFIFLVFHFHKHL